MTPIDRAVQAHSSPAGAKQPVALRPARPTDSAGISAVFLLARRQAMPYLPHLHGDNETRCWIAGTMMRHCRVTVATAHGRIIGFAAIANDWLDHLYVLPACQRSSVGMALLTAAKRQCPTGLRLHVFQRNQAARAFYIAQGFVLVELTDGSQNEEREPDACYAWRGIQD